MSTKKFAHYKQNVVEKLSYVDVSTGEVVGTDLKKHGYIANDRESYFLMYSSLVTLFMEDVSLPEVKVYSYLLCNYQIGTTFALNGAVKSVIQEKFKLARKTVDNTLSKLKTKNLVYSPSHTLYIINPRYAYKGSTSNRKSSLKAIIELGCKDC